MTIKYLFKERSVRSPETLRIIIYNMKFRGEDVRGESLPFLDCAVHNEEDRRLNIEVYRKPTHRRGDKII